MKNGTKQGLTQKSEPIQRRNLSKGVGQLTLCPTVTGPDGLSELQHASTSTLSCSQDASTGFSFGYPTTHKNLRSRIVMLIHEQARSSSEEEQL